MQPTPGQIRLDHKIPHIKIEPRDDPDDPREIKTEASIREVPLVGVALAVMRKFPNGFPNYIDKEPNLSANLNRLLKGTSCCRLRSTSRIRCGTRSRTG